MIETTATSQPWKPDLYVVARFLDIMFSNGSSMKKTNIQMLLGVNYPRFMDYLGWLLSHGLVATSIDEEGAEKIKLTPKGIDSYHRFVDWIKETMEGVKI
jgi:predicted transcriptional regulator